MKKCKILMTRKSQIQTDMNETHSYIADIAEKDDSVAFRYNDELGNHFMVMFNAGVLKLKCEGETKSRLELVEGEWSNVVLTTPFGDMILRSKTKELSRSKNHLFVSYALYQEKECIDEISIRWDIVRTGIS